MYGNNTVYTESQNRYHEKLKDPRWQKMRLEVFARDTWACCACKATDIMLAVHHKYYQKGLDPWDYPMDALLTLCAGCHEDQIAEWAEYEPVIIHELRKKFYADDLRELAWAISQLPTFKSAKASHGLARLIVWLFSNKNLQADIISRFSQHEQQESQGVE